MLARLSFLAGISIALIATQVEAATVSFLGVVTQGKPGPVLNTLPRNFVLVLDYTPGQNTVDATGTLSFPSTPNPTLPGTPSNTGVAVVTQGQMTVGDNIGAGGTDFFSFNGNVLAGGLGPNQVNYSFTFTQPSDTISNNFVNPENLVELIVGQTSISFAGGVGGFSGSGTIVGAPEPSTMIALSGLVLGGCGIGYRRRLKAQRVKDETSEA